MAEPSQTRDPLIGSTIGPYFVGQKIGTSRWGTIYRALQSTVQRPVALEILSSQLAAKPGMAEQFREEAHAAAQVVHPHLVGVYEAGFADGQHFCARELMDGPPLARLLRTDTGVDERKLVSIISLMADALDLLWLRKVAHPPPAAADIVVNRESVVKLTNFEAGGEPPSSSPHHDIVALGAALASVANEIGPVSKPVARLVERMMTLAGRAPFASLAELATTASALAQTLPAPELPEAAKRSATTLPWRLLAAIRRFTGRKGG